MITKQQKRKARHKKTRMRVKGTAQRPRLFVFRSNQHIYAQLVDDGPKGDLAKILISISDKDLKIKKGEKKSEIAKEVGKLIAKKAAGKKIENVVFDRGGFVFHGRIKSLADGARENGLKF